MITMIIAKIIVLEQDLTVFTAVHKVKKVNTGRSSKLITMFTAVQNVNIKSSCWDKTLLITVQTAVQIAMFIAKVFSS